MTREEKILDLRRTRFYERPVPIPGDELSIQEEYRRGWTIKDLALYYGTNMKTVRRIVFENDLTAFEPILEQMYGKD